MKKIKNTLLTWLITFPKLIWEIILFTLNLPRFFYLFFHGLRITAVSYSKLLDGMSSRQKTIDSLFKKNLSEQQATRIFRILLNQTIELNKEQERLFSGLFGIFIAILALFISMIALLLNK